MAISIHVPREGHDGRTWHEFSSFLQFQSTCPARGTTAQACPIPALTVISIHVPREGHDRLLLDRQLRREISIHVPREGHDGAKAAMSPRPPHFNPRAP